MYLELLFINKKVMRTKTAVAECNQLLCKATFMCLFRSCTTYL